MANKAIQVVVRALSDSGLTGQLYVGDLDIAQQMVRDGAAWYSPAESTSLSPADRESFLTLENLAKAEKRGVWGIEGMKPASQFRIEKATAEKERLDAEDQKRANEAAAARRSQAVVRTETATPPTLPAAIP